MQKSQEAILMDIDGEEKLFHFASKFWTPNLA